MDTPKRARALSLIFLVIVLVVAVAALHGQSQNKQASPSVEEATPIQEGVMTEKQKKHSKIFKGFGNSTRGRKLRDIVAERGDIDVTEVVGTTLLPESFNLHDYLKKLTCEADAVVIGTVKSKSSQLNEEGTFIFTDYEINVDEILKNNSFAPIQQNSDLTVTRSGGAVKLNGHIVRATDYRSGPLKTGEQYLLYLKFIPDTGAYRPFGNALSDDTLHLWGGDITQVSRKRLPLGPHGVANADSFLNEARGVLNSSCSNQEAQ